MVALLGPGLVLCAALGGGRSAALPLWRRALGGWSRHGVGSRILIVRMDVLPQRKLRESFHTIKYTNRMMNTG